MPASDVCAEDFRVFIEEQKSKAAPIEADVKDAKRRISSAKGPKKKTIVKAESAESDDGEGSA